MKEKIAYSLLSQIIFIIVLLFIPINFLQASEPIQTTSISVLEYGAKGDGTTDDTKPFQDALDYYGKASVGGTVFVPQGTYLIKGHLRIPDDVTLEGLWKIPTARSQFKGSTLLAVEGEGNSEGTPFITLWNNSLVKGLTIFYPNQTATNPPKSYPWTIASGGADNCSIVDVLLVNPYQAVDFGTHVSGRHYIRNLYAQPLFKGIFIDQCYDVGRIENVHLWPFWKWDGEESPLGRFMTEHAEGFIIGKTDWEYMSNCFTIFYNPGYRFINTKSGPPNVLLTQCGADVAKQAVIIENCQPHAGISFSNGQFYGRIVIKDSNTGPVRFTGCGFFGNSSSMAGDASHAEIDGIGHVSFDNCHFITIDPKDKGKVGIKANAGSLTVSNSIFMDSGKDYVVLGTDVRTAIIQGNTFQGKGNVVNHSRGNIIIKDNVTDLPKEEPGAIIIDNTDPAPFFKTEGDWKTGTGGIDYLGNVAWAFKGDGNAKAYWTPNIPSTGFYNVYAWYGGDPSKDHATDASFTVFYEQGQESKVVDLSKGFGKWHLLGRYMFKKGSSGYVMTTNKANGNVLADAVKWVPSTL